MAKSEIDFKLGYSSESMVALCIICFLIGGLSVVFSNLFMDDITTSKEKWNIRVFSGGKLIYAGSDVSNVEYHNNNNCVSFNANTKNQTPMVLCGDIIGEGWTN